MSNDPIHQFHILARNDGVVAADVLPAIVHADVGVESLGAIPAFKPLQFICRLVANHCLAVTMRALWVIYNTLLNQSNSGRLTFSSIQLNSHLTALQRRQPPQLSNQFRQFTFTHFNSPNSCARSSDTCRYCIASECN